VNCALGLLERGVDRLEDAVGISSRAELVRRFAIELVPA